MEKCHAGQKGFPNMRQNKKGMVEFKGQCFQMDRQIPSSSTERVKVKELAL